MKSIHKIFLVIALLLVAPSVSFAGAQTFTSSGTFTVPAGVTSINALIVGGGGGGGGEDAQGDQYRGGSGGSGGYSTATFSVAPAQALPVTVGTGGLPAHDRYNFINNCQTGSSGADYGLNGSSSVVGSVTVTGGGGGIGGENSAGPGPGTAGSPNGVAGSAGFIKNNFAALAGGSNGTGYGLAGSSNGDSSCPTPGQNGVVILSWTDPVTPVCGTANGKTYPYGTSSYGSDTLCAIGTPDSAVSFPPAGSSRAWLCTTSGGAPYSPMCQAWQSAAPPTPTVNIHFSFLNGIKSLSNLFS